MDLKQRLENLLELRELSQGWLAHRTGISRSNITQWLREEERDIGFTSAIAIACALDVSLNWLAGLPDGQPEALMPDEAFLLDLYRQADEPSRKMIIVMAKAAAKREDSGG